MARRRDGTAPRLDPVDPVGLHDAGVDVLRADARLDGLRITGDVTGARLPSLALDECVLERVVLDDAVLDGARIGDGVLDRVTGTAVRALRLTLRDIRVDGCRFGAAEWFEAEWDRVLVTGSRIDHLGLADARLADVRFVGCTIGGLDLRGATADRVAFEDCRIGALTLADARLTAFDLRGADLDVVDGVRHLAGAIVSEAQLPLLAPLLAEAAGIVVR